MPWQLQKSRSAELTATSKEHWQRKEFHGYVTQNNCFCNHWKALVSKQFDNAFEPFICHNGFCYDVRSESILPKFSSSNLCSVDGIKFWLLCDWIIWIIFTTFDMIITMKGGIKTVVKGRPTCIWDQLLAGLITQLLLQRSGQTPLRPCFRYCTDNCQLFASLCCLHFNPEI